MTQEKLPHRKELCLQSETLCKSRELKNKTVIRTTEQLKGGEDEKDIFKRKII